ncbi:MAG: threonine--tRNA ligase [Clostridia bacterium]|nr:threonine--tRNA ligase [Clostridia bacterium]
MVKITLKDGTVKEFKKGISADEIVKSLGAKLYKAACACLINGELKDLRTNIEDDCTLEILTFDDKLGESTYQHTAAHIMAQAVKRLYPGAKMAIGPSIDSGFYYDFDLDTTFTVEDLAKIEKEMKKIIKENLPLECFVLPVKQAIELMQEQEQPYKIELIKEHSEKGEDISFYSQGEYTDLCAGPHLRTTGAVKAYKLLSCTGAYWRGDSKGKMLQRIYGVAFPKASMLSEHLQKLEEAKKRDHNKIGRELEFFTTVDYIGQGLPIMLPKGTKVLQILQRFVEDEEEKRGYMLTKTPLIAKSDLYKISEHWYHYRDNMFIIGDSEKEEEAFALRPMTCPFQFQTYLVKGRSYRDLPMRLNETSTLFRKEASGEMHGLIRLRQFTISEGHIACMPSQLEEEFAGCVNLAKYFLDILGLSEDVTYRFSKWDENDKEKYIGDKDQWEAVQSEMRNILDNIGIKYEEADGEAAFYGPKLDIQIKNVYGKEDTLVTVQVDFQLAERFGMMYTDKDGKKKYPYVIHRTSIGCYERTLALLLEKYAGALPVWLSPEQVRILPISEKYKDYAEDVEKQLKALGIRVTLDDRNEKTGYKIREAQKEKIPFMLIVGEQEQNENNLSVRIRGKGDIGKLSRLEFIDMISKNIAEKSKEV